MAPTKLNNHQEYEVYRTPVWVYKILIDKYPKHFRCRIIDPTAGCGRMLSYIVKRGNKKRHFIADIRKEELIVWNKNKRLKNCKKMIGDFRTLKIRKNRYDCSITNPPFSLAKDLVDMLLKTLKPGGYIWILQRIDWLASQRRSLWHCNHKCLVKVEILSKRPIWEIDGRENNSSDSRDYAWFLYRSGNTKKPTIDWLITEK